MTLMKLNNYKDAIGYLVEAKRIQPDNLKASSLLSGQNVLENIPLLDIVKRGDALPMMMANRSVKGLAATLM